MPELELIGDFNRIVLEGDTDSHVHAIVVGVSNPKSAVGSQWSDNDAEAFGNLIEARRGDVVTLLDATRVDILKALHEIATRVDPASTVIFPDFECAT